MRRQAEKLTLHHSSERQRGWYARRDADGEEAAQKPNIVSGFFFKSLIARTLTSGIALFAPRVAVGVVAVALPEA